jgi:hypothetical protein
MDKLDYVAVYAAVVSTIVLVWDIYKWATQGPKIHFEVYTKKRPADYEHPRLADDPLIVIATNRGDRPTTITSVTLRCYSNIWTALLRRPMESLRFLAREESPIPHELAPGAVWKFIARQEPKIVRMAATGLLYCTLEHSFSSRIVRRRVRLSPATEVANKDTKENDNQQIYN